MPTEAMLGDRILAFVLMFEVIFLFMVAFKSWVNSTSGLDN